MSINCDVLIVGGGLVGASLACALRGSAHRVELIEAYPLDDASQPCYDDRTVALSWGSRRILEGLDLWPQLDGRIEPIKTIHISDRGHFGATRLRHSEEGVEALGYVAENRVLGEVMYRELQRQHGLVMRCPAKLLGLEQSAERVTAIVEQDGGESTISARLLVAADGVASQVRELLHIGAAVQDYGQSAVVANVTPGMPHENIAYERFTDTGPVAMLPMTGNRCALVWTVPTAQARELVALDDAAFLEQLQQRFGYRLGVLKKTGRRQLYPLTLTESTQIVRGRAVIVGNAAHTIHPVAGQGFNLALRDIAMLAELIHAADDPGAASLLQTYIEAREQDAKRVYRFTDTLVKIFSNDNGPLGHTRAAGLIAVGLVPELRHWLARQSMGLSGRLSRLGRGLPAGAGLKS
jgi:2-octaprenyl-6-methoxyphenol hydroxylase